MSEFRRHGGFCSLALLSLVAFWPSLQRWASLSLADPRYSHLIVIPLMAAGIVFLERRKIFTAVRYCLRPGLLLLTISFALHLLVRIYVPFGPDHQLAAETLTIALVWTAAFAVCYGTGALSRARFAFLFLLLVIPVPSSAMDRIISTLQHGSAEATYALFTLAGVPCFRDGVRFELPGISIEVAPECSGIHSGVALFIMSLLLGHLFLRSGLGKLCLSVVTIPVAMFTNAIRIVTIWWLGTKVDVGFLYGKLHHRGGILFSCISLSILISFLLLFRRLDRRRKVQVEAQTALSLTRG